MTTKTDISSTPGKGEIILYQSPDGKAALDVRLEGETLWLNLNQMAGLLERDKSVISRHPGNIFKTEELEREATVASFAIVQDEGGEGLSDKSSFSTSTPSSPWVIGSIRSAAPSFASGPPMCCGITF